MLEVFKRSPLLSFGAAGLGMLRVKIHYQRSSVEPLGRFFVLF